MPANPMRFIEGPPTFGAEVRSENDYGDAAEAEMAEKRADYFAAGTLVVWDVDPVAECIHVYRASDPSQPTTIRRGQVAEAEPAVPGCAWPLTGFSLSRQAESSITRSCPPLTWAGLLRSLARRDLEDW